MTEVFLFAKKPDSFEKFYEAFKQSFLVFLGKYKEFVDKYGREPNEDELDALIKEWLEEEGDS